MPHMTHVILFFSAARGHTVAIKLEKKEGESIDYNSKRVKELKAILDQRGVRCQGCTEKAEFVKKCQETENLDL